MSEISIEDLHYQVLNKLRTYIARCERIRKILAGKKSLSLSQRESVRDLYKALKKDLTEASNRGSLLSRAQRKENVPFEDTIYGSAVLHAYNVLRPKTNTDPVNSHWCTAVGECQSELQYYLDRLTKKSD